MLLDAQKFGERNISTWRLAVETNKKGEAVTYYSEGDMLDRPIQKGKMSTGKKGTISGSSTSREEM